MADSLTILHTNDLHGKLTDRAMEIIAREKDTASPCLLVDCGDAISSGNIYYRPGGEPVLAKLSELGYDAMVMGNREFHFASSGLKSKIKLASFPVLCSNLHDKNESELGSLIHRSLVVEVGNVRVGLCGLTVQMITRKMFASKVSPYWFDDPATVAREVVPQLHAEADLVIALTHIGFQRDQELARAVSGIDLIVGGHSHTILADPVWVNSTAIVQAGWWGHYLGKTSISMERSADGRLGIHTELVDLRQ